MEVVITTATATKRNDHENYDNSIGYGFCPF
jgi:hypothetical protein